MARPAHQAGGPPPLRARQMFGKYRIEGCFAEGGFARLFRAYDTIEGVRVALKMPHPWLIDRETLETFRKEVKVNAQLDHPNILPIKYAGFIEERFAIVYPLGRESLEDRLRRRVGLKRAMEWADQMLDALAYAHRRRILHGDVKPENFIVFHGTQLRLADFGLAKVTTRTMTASGSGTVGYVAPEQAMGRPSQRSDVFSLGLILYRMFTGTLPAWPFEWPPAGIDRLRRLHPDLEGLLRRALEVDHRRRFQDAAQLQAAWRRLRPKVLARASGQRRRRRRAADEQARWKEARIREFRRRFGTRLEARHDCRRCGGPVSEAMQACPWCGTPRRRHGDDTRLPARCPRCRRGRKLDWRFCPWCYGRAFRTVAERSYSDTRYAARCPEPGCQDRRLMPFMRYCPWCRRKVRRGWKVPGSNERCRRCGWGVLGEYWAHCPWCAARLAGH